MKQTITQSEAVSEYYQSISEFDIWALLFVDVLLVGGLVVASLLL